MSDYDLTGNYSHWADFYRRPDNRRDGDTIDRSFIDFLWMTLHCKNPDSQHTAEKFASIAIELIDLVWSPSNWDILVWLFTRPHTTRVLYTVDSILDSKQHLGDTCYGLIGDISQEIDSGSSTFSASLRNRCKAANLTIEHETRRLESVMHKQDKDLNLQTICNIHYYISRCFVVSCLACFLFGLLTSVASIFFTVSPEIAIRGLSLAYVMGHLVYEEYHASKHLLKISGAVALLHYYVLRSIWAWRDMGGLFALITDSKLSDVPHAKRFLEAFEASFMGGHVELWKTRSRVKNLSKYADKVRVMKDQDVYDDATASTLS
ncbi:uncharacterized protein ARMOST_14664 [Armillaria ostoyae]|uniref:Uncharacterized protein n=1 Tax=Armillaria ostoyae TaxID=47428 RepID=A0A284RR72_ARMOS|nr:uncharacterized protein ARMOST_14664 [Armillaria ostoyae]